MYWGQGRRGRSIWLSRSKKSVSYLGGRVIKVAIVVLNWNNAPDTLECLTSLDKLDHPEVDVIVVDNGSTDDSLDTIRSRFPDHIYIENGENLGYAEGNNRGLQEGIDRKADLLLLLNNDTIVAPNMVSEIVKAAQQNEDVAVFGPTVYFHDQPDRISFAGGGVNKETGKCYHIGSCATEGHTDEMLTDYIVGCALAIRAKVAEKVGLISPEYFLIWEEVDWCWRIRKAGYFCLFVPTAKIWHKTSNSFVDGKRGPMWQYFYFRNRLLFHKRHTGWTLPRGELIDLVKTSYSFKTPPEQKKLYRAALAGVVDYYLGRFGKGRLHKFIQK